MPMATPMDFDMMFRQAFAKKLRGAGEIGEEEAEALLGSVYEEWANAPDARLGGISPRQWFLGMSSPEELIACLEDYARARVDVPDLLLERFESLGEDAAPALERLLADGERPGAARGHALSLLLEIAPSRCEPLVADIVLGAEESSDLAEHAAEALGEATGISVRQKLLEGYENASEYAKMLILEILCNFPGDNRIYIHMRDMLVNDPERRAFAARLLGRLGDARAIEPMKKLLSMSDLTYFEYMEIRNAIEALGGEVVGEREFYGDPDYEHMRSLE